MRTVGQILKEAREAKYYSLDEVEKATKIRKELLEALESDNYSKLPPSTFVQGFIKNYARFLNVDSQKLLAIFRREFSEKKHKPYIMDTFANPINKKRLEITPKRVLGLTVAGVILVFFVYLWFQYRQFVGAPDLALTSPVDQLTTDNPTVSVEGKTDPEAKVAVNGQEIPVSATGEFKESMTLTSAVNKIAVVSSSRFGQKSELDRTVYLKR